MNKVKSQMRKAKKQGLSANDLWRMKEIAKKQALEMEAVAIEKAFLYMLAIPLNILVNDYWPKTAKKRAPEFIQKVLSLYDSVQCHIVTDEDLAELLLNMADVTIEAEWLKAKSE